MHSMLPKYLALGTGSNSFSLSQPQLDLIQSPLDAKIFLEGPWGCGKSTVGVKRLLFLLAQGVPAEHILLLAPQRTLIWPYSQAMETPGVVVGGQVLMLTIGGLAQNMVELFWPMIAESVGFTHPERPPVFLTLETAQYYMAYLVRPLLEEGYFSSLTIERNRIFSQILDNLNKAALVGFDYTEIGERLNVIQIGEPGQQHVFADAQRCATKFREYCLAHNLLDFSLQVEVFWRHLWALPLCRDHLIRTFRHLIIDNLEEDTPITHDLLSEWLPDCDSALLIFDREAGYRSFLGADPQTGYALRELCSERAKLDSNFVVSPEIQSLRACLAFELNSGPTISNTSQVDGRNAIDRALCFEYHRYYPEMLDWVTSEIKRLLESQIVHASEIVVLAPFLPDASLYSLIDRFQQAGIPVRSHRPSRSLRDEPITQCLLTLAELANPEWGQSPLPFDIAHLLVQAIDGMDWVRAQILSQVIYPKQKNDQPRCLVPYPVRNTDLAERITDRYLQKYEHLRQWLEEYSPIAGEGLDHFWGRLFGEVLSQRGYGFHRDFQAGEVTANLIESARKFRQASTQSLEEDGTSVGLEYIRMVRDGVIAAQYLRSWNDHSEEAVLLAPAHTFIMGNRSARVQFWLNINSSGWYERLYQPLTNPYVLSRQWPSGRRWSDFDEEEVRKRTLSTLILGLLDRCTERLYLGWSDLNEQGREEHGRLLHSFQQLMRHSALSVR